jgi:uncharacterized protein (DUF2236 family)
MRIPERRGPRADNGFYGPGSMAWEITAHPVITIANLRNVVYSVLNSEVSQSVLDHSSFRVDPWQRSLETNYWVYASVFGDTEEATRAGMWVQGKHAKVKGHDPVSHTDYSPMRPDLAIAGHCLIWDSNLAAYDSLVRSLSTIERDQYWREGMVSARLIGIDPAILPKTYSDWRDYYAREIRPRLNVSAAAYQLLDFTRSATYVPVWARPVVKAGLALAEELTMTTLDPLERGIYGKPRSRLTVAATRRFGHQLAVVANASPVRDAIERTYGERVHTLLREARAIQRQYERTTAPPMGDVA